MSQPKTGGRIPAEFTDAFGRYFTTWSSLEAIMEIGIAKLLDLDPVRGSIVTANLQFKTKAEMLLSLLNLDQSHAAAAKVVKTLLANSERNNLAHGIAMVGTGTFTVLRRRVDGKLKSRKHVYTIESFNRTIAELDEALFELASQLAIDPSDANAFFHLAHNAATSGDGKT